MDRITTSAQTANDASGRLRSQEAPLVLFGLERSVYTRVARLAIEQKGVPCSLKEVEIFGPDGVPAEHLARHPFGRIPVLWCEQPGSG